MDMIKSLKQTDIQFLSGNQVTDIAAQLLGKLIETNVGGQITIGRIVETEAYKAFIDRAAHSWNGRRTKRNEAMYLHGGAIYVYLCYGLHKMLNIVTNDKNIPDAILIRGIEPIKGLAVMSERTGKAVDDRTLTKGPGNLAKALAVDLHHSGQPLNRGGIYTLYEDGFFLTQNQIGVSKRIGIENSGTDKELPYRFYIKGNPYVSAAPRL